MRNKEERYSVTDGQAVISGKTYGAKALLGAAIFMSACAVSLLSLFLPLHTSVFLVGLYGFLVGVFSE